MFNQDFIKYLEDASKFNINIEEKEYILAKFDNMIKNCDKLAYLPQTDEIFLYHIEDEIV